MDRHFATRDLFACFTDVAAQRRRFRERNARSRTAIASFVIDQLVFDDRIGASGHGSARHDTHAFIMCQIAFIGGTSGDLRNDLQLHRSIYCCAFDLCCFEREAIHGCMGERRDIDIAGEVFGSHAPYRINKTHLLNFKRMDVLEDDLASFFDAHHL